MTRNLGLQSALERPSQVSHDSLLLPGVLMWLSEFISSLLLSGATYVAVWIHFCSLLTGSRGTERTVVMDKSKGVPVISVKTSGSKERVSVRT